MDCKHYGLFRGEDYCFGLRVKNPGCGGYLETCPNSTNPKIRNYRKEMHICEEAAHLCDIDRSFGKFADELEKVQMFGEKITTTMVKKNKRNLKGILQVLRR